MLPKNKLEEISILADFAHTTAFDIGAEGNGDRERMFAVADMLRRCREEIEGLQHIVDAADKMRLAWHNVKIYGIKNGYLTIEGVEGMNDSYNEYQEVRG